MILYGITTDGQRAVASQPLSSLPLKNPLNHMSLKKIKKTVSKKTARKAGSKVKNMIGGNFNNRSGIDKPVREFWEQLAWADISETFGERTTERGRRYGEGGNVRSLWQTKDGKTLLAVVSGEYDYKTLVTLEDGRKKNSFAIFSDCSCPVGSTCKHGVAAITRFLDSLSKGKSVPLCVQIDDETWETYTTKGEKNILKIDFDECLDEDEDDWDDDEDIWENRFPARKRMRRTVVSLPKEPPWNPETLRRKLKGKTPEELTSLILQLAEDHPVVRKRFQQQLFVESASKSGKADKIVQKAVRMIDQGMDRGNFFDYDYYGHGGPSVDLDSVTELVRQFKQFDDPLPGLSRISEHLLKEGGRFLEDTGAEDDEEFREVFDVIATVLLQSKSDPAQIVLWSYKMNDLDQYGMVDEMGATIRAHFRSDKIWSEIADRLVADLKKQSLQKRHFMELRRAVEALDHAKRQEEATDLLRKEAPKVDDYVELVDRLISFKYYGEAKDFAMQRLRKKSKEHSRLNFDHDIWFGKLRTIAEHEKDWPTLASIHALQVFSVPTDQGIKRLLDAAKKMKVEPVIRKELERFLQTGELPAAVISILAGKKPSPAAKKVWPVPVFFFQPKPIQAGPRYDVLCEWAIKENRPKDVLRWFAQLKSRPALMRNIDVIDIADAVVDLDPNRALTIYLKQAEHEMEVTRHYPMAVRHLNKAKKALKKAGRETEWPKIMEDIRARHRRKPSLMKQLAEFESGPIARRKRPLGR